MASFLMTPRLTLRPLGLRDVDAVFAMMSDDETMRFWDWPAFKDRDTVADVVEAQIEDAASGQSMYWAVALTPEGAAIGSCDLSDIDRHHRRAEIGFLFNRGYWGNGYAREAMEAVVAFAFEDLELERLWARFHSGNLASQRLLERLGFSREGTLRRHVIRDGVRRDCEIYGRMR
ncbi:MAG TPA: GNAT family N-acetyltransferase [Rhizomicrobium sp.]|nr:GNAT family N-acetyltransferase [Rhizomicrobium sp.]